MLTQGTTLSHIITLVKSAQVAVRILAVLCVTEAETSTSAPVIETYLSGSAGDSRQFPALHEFKRRPASR